jgi:triacylglycerol lipase
MPVAKLPITTHLLFIASFLMGALSHYFNHPIFEWCGWAFLSVWMLEGINALSPYFPRPIESIIHWIRAMFWEFFAILKIFFVRVSCLSPRKWTGNPKGRPILLVAGYLNDRSAWNFQRKHLKCLGRVYTIDLGHPFRSIHHYAEKIHEKAKEIVKETGRTDLILIGHSMGGLVSSWYATHFATPGTVTDLITIASPLSGTKIARIGVGPNAKEMRPDSSFIRDLKKKMADETKIRFYHLATRTDQLVIPGESAYVKGNDHFIFEDLGHASMLYSLRVTQKIKERLGRGC